MGNKIVRYALLIMALVIAGSTDLVSRAATEDTKAATYGGMATKTGICK